MLIDCNFMLGGGSAVRHAVAEECALRTLRDYGIDKAVAYHAEARYYDVISGNRRLIEFTKTDDAFIPCFVLSPGYKAHTGGYSSARQMISENSVRFVRIFPGAHGYAFESGLTEELFSVAEEMNVTMMLEMQEIFSSDGHFTGYFESLCGKHPNLPVIVIRCMHRRNYTTDYYLENLGNVYIEPSIMNNWLFYEETIRLHGSKRVIWGSSMPFNDAGCSVSMLAYADITQEERADISSGNIMRLLNLNP